MLKNPKIGQKIYYFGIYSSWIGEYVIKGIGVDFVDCFDIETNQREIILFQDYCACDVNPITISLAAKLRELFHLPRNAANCAKAVKLWENFNQPDNNELKEEIEDNG